MWYLYITGNSNDHFYAGVTTNLERRFKEHRQGKGGRYTSHNRPLKLFYFESFPDRKEAQARESQIKHWSRNKKKALIDGDVDKLRQLSVSRDITYHNTNSLTHTESALFAGEISSYF